MEKDFSSCFLISSQDDLGSTAVARRFANQPLHLFLVAVQREPREFLAQPLALLQPAFSASKAASSKQRRKAE